MHDLRIHGTTMHICPPGLHRPLLLLVMLFFASCGDGTQTATVSDVGTDASPSVSDMGTGMTDVAIVPDLGAPDAMMQVDQGTSDVSIADASNADADADASPDGGTNGDEMAVTGLELVIDRDVDVAPTPINQAYVAEIDATVAGDRIYSYQKYFHSEPIIIALMNAARRGVEVRGYYGDDVDPSCASLLEATDTIDCSAMFTKAASAHHKNLMVLRGDGTVRGIVGSYNPRLRNASDPRVHTVLVMEVANGGPLFDFYAAEADRLTGSSTSQPLTMSVPVAAGGELSFTFHPGPASPVLDLLNEITSCDGTLWLSYFDVFPDTVGNPVFDRLKELVDGGCDVRFLMNDSLTNAPARVALLNRGVPTEYAEFATGDGTLGHKIVSVVSGGEAHLMQGSANLNLVNHNVNNNLSVHVRVSTTDLHTVIENELLRYWP